MKAKSSIFFLNILLYLNFSCESSSTDSLEFNETDRPFITNISDKANLVEQFKYHDNGCLKEKSTFFNGELVYFFHNIDSIGRLMEKRRSRKLKEFGPVVAEYIIFDSNAKIDFDKSKFIQFVPSDFLDTIYLNSVSSIPIQVSARYPGNHPCRILLKYSNNSREIVCNTNEWVLDTLEIYEEISKIEIDVQVEYLPKVFEELYTHRFIKQAF